MFMIDMLRNGRDALGDLQCSGLLAQEVGLNRLHKFLRTSLDGTQIWFGRGCTAGDSKPIPISRGIFAKIGTYF